MNQLPGIICTVQQVIRRFFYIFTQMKFIQNLQAALVRIENGTYGICRETGKLIPKERLRAVPHATLSIEAKEAKKRKRNQFQTRFCPRFFEIRTNQF